MTDADKFKFYEVILTERDYDRAMIKLDLAGFKMPKDLASWLKSYYSAWTSGDVSSLPSPDIAIEILDGANR